MAYIQDELSCIRSPQVPYDTRLYNFFRRYLLQKAISVFKWCFPDTWNEDQIRHFLYTLYMKGYIGVLDTEKYGVVALECSFSGLNLFYSPTEFIIANPLLKNEKRTIGVDGCLIRLEPDVCGYGPNPFITEFGAMDIIDNYAEQMALATQALDVNILNSQLAYMFGVSDKTAAETLKKMYAKVASGDPAVFVDKNLFNDDGTKAWDTFQNDLKSNFIANDIQLCLENINDQFCTMIGLPNANKQKKERMITDEVNSNNIETSCLSDIWLETLQEGCDKVNEMFDINISVEKRYKEEVEDNGDDISNTGHSDDME